MNEAAAALERLASDYWSAYLRRHPTTATTLAVHDHDDRLEDPSPEARDEWLSTVRALQARAEAVPAAALTRGQGVTRAILMHELRSHVDAARLEMDLWSVDQLGGPQVWFFDLPRLHELKTPRSVETFLARVEAMPAYVDQVSRNLAAGKARGLLAPRCTVERVLTQLDDLQSAGPAACSLLTATTTRHESVPEAAWTRFRTTLETSVGTRLFPALDRYRSFLRAEILPASRTTPGLVALPNGLALYDVAIEVHVTLRKRADELHELGLSEMARIHVGMREIASSLFPGEPLDAALRRLRDDRAYSFANREEIVATARQAVSRATAAAKRVFAEMPDHECVVTPIDAHAEKASPAAFYLHPSPDGARPGTYFVNTYEPTSRPRFEAEVVAFHEAVPGHHLQIALAQKLSGVAEFQRHSSPTAYVEGWALYTESLSRELNLYSGPLDLLGMYSCDAWRAARLVVDTGLHAFGWSRERAIEYMRSNTAASMTDIQAEVDRYVSWPGQALSYKVGQLEILQLRQQAEQALGSAFDIREFHRVVLGSGGVTLPVLRAEVEGWIERQRAGVAAGR